MNFFHLKSPALYVWYMYWSVAVSINLTWWLFTFIDRPTKINTSHKITSKQSARKVKCSIFIQVVVLTSLPWTREFVWRPTNNQNIWILKIPQCSIGKNVQRRHMMLFGAQFRTCGILGKNGKRDLYLSHDKMTWKCLFLLLYKRKEVSILWAGKW